jgi:uncharacterized metal-binding protein YceD (DUF177 family)
LRAARCHAAKSYNRNGCSRQSPNAQHELPPLDLGLPGLVFDYMGIITPSSLGKPHRMPTVPPNETILRVSSLKQTAETRFLLEPDADTRAQLAQELNAQSIKKLRFEGKLSPRGKKGWTLTAKIGATVVQSCIVTLEPITTRIDSDVIRHFVPETLTDQPSEGSETEMTEDENTDILQDEIDLNEIMSEALDLVIPSYPRKEDANLDAAQFSEPGVSPLQEEDLKPFAGLAALREKMQDQGDKD